MNRKDEQEILEIWNEIRLALTDIAYSLRMMQSK
jgi:hypothetical protein